VDEDYRLSIPKLFARWAGEDFHSWQEAIGVSVTHLSRGNGRVTDVSQEAGNISIHIQYARAVREHPLCEFRTEFIQMTLPTALTRDDVIATLKERRLLHEQDAEGNRISAPVAATGTASGRHARSNPDSR
jgi:hypothetical protein